MQRKQLKIQDPFMMKPFDKLGTKGDYLKNIIKIIQIYEKIHSKHHSQSWQAECFSSKIRKKVSFPAFATSVQCLKSRDITLLTKIHTVESQSYGFSSSHVWIWELAHKEGWAVKNWCFWPVVMEKILESPLDCKEIQPVHPKWNWHWIFIGRTDAEADAPVLWPPDV